MVLSGHRNYRTSDQNYTKEQSVGCKDGPSAWGSEIWEEMKFVMVDPKVYILKDRKVYTSISAFLK